MTMSLDGRMIGRVGNTIISSYICLFFYASILWLLPGAHAAEPWTANGVLEASQTADAGLLYQRFLYQQDEANPVRVHVLTVSDLSVYRLNVMGCYGALIQPSVFARQSGAVAAVNGGFFLKDARQGIGLVEYNRRVLFAPSKRTAYSGTLGLHPKGILIDWIRTEDVQDRKITKPDWDTCYASLAAGPILVKDATLTLPVNPQGFTKLTTKEPRTAIGEKADGTVLLVVVDGRQPQWSTGLSLMELGELFLAYDAQSALNLDGGGSSVMVLEHEIVNHPSDGAIFGQAGIERAVSTAVGVFRKKTEP